MDDNCNSAVVSATGQLVTEINALHKEVICSCRSTEGQLQAALTAAWRAGGLLIDAKRTVRAGMGHGAWRDWLAKNFAASERTAQRYMQLAKSVTAVTDLAGLSLRQAYQRLGLKVEEHGAVEKIKTSPQIGPGRAIRQLLGRLPGPTEFWAMKRVDRERLLSDLTPLYRRLNEIFKSA